MIPSPSRRPASTFAGLGLAAVLILAGCGRVGVLEQPAPLYGAKAKADYQARKAAAAAKAQTDKDDGKPEPLAPDTPGPDAPRGRPQTLRAQPIPGAASPPNAPGTGGVLPDPFNRPQ
jgi:hypothetical protein